MVSRTHDILKKITQVIQDIGLIRNNSTKQLKKQTKQGGKGLPYKRTEKWKCTDVQSETGCTHFEDSTNTPSKLGPANTPDTLEHCAPTHHTSLSSLPIVLHSLDRTHTCPADSPLPTLAACELGEPCSTGDTAVQNESSDSCDFSLASSPPSEELEQDSREGTEGEEPLDPGGVGGTTGED
jgi:hypothetical protein